MAVVWCGNRIWKGEENMKKAIVIAIGLTLVITAAGFAGQGRNPHAKIAIHTQATAPVCTVKAWPVFTSCSAIKTTFPGSGVPVYVMPVFYDLVEFTVTEFGLQWPALWYTMIWARCKGDIAVGGISQPGDGTAISWSACQTMWSICPGVGSFANPAYVTQGQVCPIPYFATGDYGVVDCQPSPGPYYDYPEFAHCAGIGGIIGDDPCEVTATQPSTWGEIKSIFK